MTTISDERLADTLLTWHYDNPAYFAVAIFPNGERLPVDSLREQSRIETTYKAALQSLRAQGGVRVKSLFDLLVDAYVRGIAWQQENPGGEVGYAGKAAYDYADKITSSLEASPAPVSEEMVERINEQVEHVRLGIACRTPDVKAATIELLNQVTALTAALAAKGAAPEPAPVSEEIEAAYRAGHADGRTGGSCVTVDDEWAEYRAALAAKGGQ